MNTDGHGSPSVKRFFPFHGSNLSGSDLVPSVEDKMREHGRPGELNPVAVTAPPAKDTAALHQGQRDNVNCIIKFEI
jgi:hypothetical protein